MDLTNYKTNLDRIVESLEGDTPSTDIYADSLERIAAALEGDTPNSDIYANPLDRIATVLENGGGGGGGSSIKTCTVHLINKMATPSSTNGIISCNCSIVNEGSVMFQQGFKVQPGNGTLDIENVLVLTEEHGEERTSLVFLVLVQSKYKSFSVSASSLEDENIYTDTLTGTTGSSGGILQRFLYSKEITNDEVLTVTIQ